MSKGWLFCLVDGDYPINRELPDHLQEVARRSMAEEERAFLFFIETEVCTYDPRSMDGWPLGQMHCPVCGSMQVCGLRHIGFGANEHGNWRDYEDGLSPELTLIFAGAV